MVGLCGMPEDGKLSSQHRKWKSGETTFATGPLSVHECWSQAKSALTYESGLRHSLDVVPTNKRSKLKYSAESEMIGECGDR